MRSRFQFLAMLGLVALAGAGCSSARISNPAVPSLTRDAAYGAGIESFAKTQPLLYVPGGKGVYIYSETGKKEKLFATSTGANDLSMDDAGGVYVEYSTASVAHAVRYTIGAQNPDRTYTPSTNDLAGVLWASHQGELIWMRFHSLSSQSAEEVYDVWDPNAKGAPSRTFVYPTGTFSMAVDNNGALYVPYYDKANKSYRYDVIPAGASKPSRTIVEKLVTGAAAQSFSPFTMTALSDGTLYVGEWSFFAGDTLTGLYVYPPKGKERHVTTGASYPTGTAVDASGNVYVLNSSYGITVSGTWQCDTVHTLSVYSSEAERLTSQATSGFVNGDSLTVASDGTSFINEFPYSPSSGCKGNQGTSGLTASVLPGAASGKTIIHFTGQDLSIFDGTHATNANAQALP